MLAIKNFFEALHRLLDRNVLAFAAGENFRDVKRLTEEPLNLARAIDGQLVVRTQFVHSEDGDDVLQIFVTLQNFLHAAGNAVVLFADNFRRE